MKNSTRTKSNSNSEKDISYYYMSYIWANPTWDFLHSFAAKINENFYTSNRSMCYTIILRICNVLPCPYCQKHAKTFFSNVKVSNLPTKQNLIQLILNFHNDVNKRTGKTLLTLKDLDKYNRSIFINISKNFIYIFGSYKGTLGSGFSDTLSRKKLIKDLIEWINQYYTNFL